ncbi:hypothetical protein K440DRAFT_638890 [Wilcoxina mikolae CBS 423.85]|nr:hypothetical protein K440DRAFT_638890 [Wilcoxina mikolae CBS 423.85]
MTRSLYQTMKVGHDHHGVRDRSAVVPITSAEPAPYSTISQDHTMGREALEAVRLESLVHRQRNLEVRGNEEISAAGTLSGFLSTSLCETGNHTLQECQMQLRMLEQQNKQRLMQATIEQDSIAQDYIANFTEPRLYAMDSAGRGSRIRSYTRSESAPNVEDASVTHFCRVGKSSGAAGSRHFPAIAGGMHYERNSIKMHKGGLQFTPRKGDLSP